MPLFDAALIDGLSSVGVLIDAMLVAAVLCAVLLVALAASECGLVWQEWHALRPASRRLRSRLTAKPRRATG
jgi:hypothetical protein